mgnify:FL=1
MEERAALVGELARCKGELRTHHKSYQLYLVGSGDRDFSSESLGGLTRTLASCPRLQKRLHLETTPKDARKFFRYLAQKMSEGVEKPKPGGEARS